MRGFMPVLRGGLAAGKKFVASPLGQSLKNSLLTSGTSALTGVAADLLEGKDFKTAASEQVEEAKKKLASTLRGSGRKRKTTSTSTSTSTSKSTSKCKKRRICLSDKRKKTRRGNYNLLEDD
jgi:hypothetical protein